MVKLVFRKFGVVDCGINDAMPRRPYIHADCTKSKKKVLNQDF